MTEPNSFAVIFDMDGVIVDSNPWHSIALRDFCARKGMVLSEEEMRQRVYGRTNRDWITQVFGTLPEDRLQRYADEKEAMYRDLYSGSIKAVNGLREFLDELQRRGIPKAIGTSAPPENVVFTLQGTGLRGHFPTILDATRVTHGKPHPEIYLNCAAALDMSPKQCVVIEDSLSGIQAAQSAGSPVIAITTTHSADELKHADLIIADFSELSVDRIKEAIFPA